MCAVLPLSSETDELTLAPHTQIVELLSTIPGIQAHAAQVLIAECGLDMSCFPTVAHLPPGPAHAPATTNSPAAPAPMPARAPARPPRPSPVLELRAIKTEKPSRKSPEKGRGLGELVLRPPSYASARKRSTSGRGEPPARRTTLSGPCRSSLSDALRSWRACAAARLGAIEVQAQQAAERLARSGPPRPAPGGPAAPSPCACRRRPLRRPVRHAGARAA